ncbi:hypothetical protein CsSME_00038217 [Camellia sinensis var. sinensis]
MVFNEYKALEESKYFVVPGLPDRIELAKAQLLASTNPSIWGLNNIRAKIREAEISTYGIVANIFEELGSGHVKEYQKATGNKVWCIGPVSLCNEDKLDKAERGNESALDAHHCLNWLDSQQPRTVVYVCLGSLSHQALSKMIEIGLGLEASNKAFIWVIRDKVEELEKWNLEDGFKERTKDRGLLIRGWTPQVLILSHRAIGRFVTHCGWNSTLEEICAGMPITTWPMFGEQFCIEKLIVQVLRIGVSVGVDVSIRWEEEEKVGAIGKLMDGGEEGEERKKRARQLGEMAKRAMEEGGSSHLNMAMLIQDIMEKATSRQCVCVCVCVCVRERERERERESTIVEYHY